MTATAVEPQPQPQKRPSNGSAGARRSTGAASDSPPPSDTLPSAETLEAAGRINVIDVKNQAHAFSTLYAKPGRHMVIFVRHAFCGMCQEFLQQFNAAITPEDLEALPTPTTVSVIYGGEPVLTEHYIKVSRCRFPVYSNASPHGLYQKLGMHSSLALGTKPMYQTSSTSAVVVRGIAQGLSQSKNALKGGKSAQLGGDLLFEDGVLTWCHYMNGTRDHTPIPALKTLLMGKAE